MIANSKVKIGLMRLFSLGLGCALMFVSCKFDRRNDNDTKYNSDEGRVVEVVTEAMDFQVRDTIASGWTTFLYKNNSTEPHFFLLNKYPLGKTIVDNQKEIIPIFQKGMDLIHKGQEKEGFTVFKELPPWFFKVTYSGGSGLISPNLSSQTTLRLDPGYYLMECYVKMPSGKFHTSMGMTKPLIVQEKRNYNKPPQSGIDVVISSQEGIVFQSSIPKGIQTFKVYFKDQFLYENFVGHDINLVRLLENSNSEILEEWMDWTRPKGLITPAPKGIIFLGGVNDLPSGGVGYFKVNLLPGKYAFVSEVPNAFSKSMLQTFTVSE